MSRKYWCTINIGPSSLPSKLRVHILIKLVITVQDFTFEYHFMQKDCAEIISCFCLSSLFSILFWFISECAQAIAGAQVKAWMNEQMNRKVSQINNWANKIYTKSHFISNNGRISVLYNQTINVIFRRKQCSFMPIVTYFYFHYFQI